jgi:cytohesin
VEALLAAGADVNAAADAGLRWTPLHEAAFAGHARVMQALLQAGADREARDVGGRTPLHAAVMANQIGTVRALLSAGADSRALDEGGHTPLDYAELQGKGQLAELLRGDERQGQRGRP